MKEIKMWIMISQKLKPGMRIKYNNGFCKQRYILKRIYRYKSTGQIAEVVLESMDKKRGTGYAGVRIPNITKEE